MHLTVFGASGPTGRLAVRQALSAGHHVTAVTRTPSAFPVSDPQLDVVRGDVTDPDSVERAVSRAEAVISTYGVPYSRHPVSVYSVGMSAVTGAMAACGVDRLVCVTSTTVAPGHAPGDSVVWRGLVTPLLRHVVGRTLYDDMERMERVVRDSGLDWTIVRPGGLYDAPEPSAAYDVSAARLRGHATSRADLAQTLVREACTRAHSRQTIEVISRSGPPHRSRTFLRQALGRGD